MEFTPDAIQLIAKGLGMDMEEHISTEAQILDVIAKRVRYLLDHDAGLLFSYMYRMDVLEVDINVALNNKKLLFPDKALAELIFARQVKRIKMRQQYKVEPIEDGWE